MALKEFKILPYLGRKTNVPADDPTLFQMVAENIAITHDVGGINFDLRRKKNACTKSKGYTTWSNSATAQATKCLGLFALDDGTNRDYCFMDNGKFYVYDSNLDPADKTKAATTYATDNKDLYSMIRVGSHIVFTDRAETAIQSWKNGDANAADAVSSGTSVKARYLEYFSNRVMTAYTDQTNGDIDIRWTGILPVAQSSFVFAAANQLYVPNDDSIVGIKKMGIDRCYIYSENSIHQIAYVPDYASPFRCYTMVPSSGGVNHHSIVSLGDRHFLFNRDYGFCEYRGDTQFPYGLPISDDIEEDIVAIDPDYYDLIVGAWIPLTRKIVWTVPASASTTPNQLWFYDIETKQWTFENKAMRYVAPWRMFSTYTWTNLIADYGATWATVWNTSWGEFFSSLQRLVYAGTDGKLYYQQGEEIPSGNIDGYRIEPILSFGNRRRLDLLLELWLDIAQSGDFEVDIYHRAGNTTGELVNASWISLGSISCNSPATPAIRNIAKEGRLHQIKWGTDADNEKFQINGMTFKYKELSEN